MRIVMPMKVDPLFDGWWIGVPDEDGVERHAVQVRAGDTYCLDWVSPQPTKEHAESFLYWDHLESYWEHGLSVYAQHCLKCGWFAKVLAFDNKAHWAWQVTECRRCGIVDSRLYKSSSR